MRTPARSRSASSAPSRGPKACARKSSGAWVSMHSTSTDSPEVMGPGVANECIEAKDGPVVVEDHFYPEVINPETGAVLPEGEVGELVLTSLTKEALPVIRYRTRDRTRLLPPTARSMRRIDRITGRTDDMLIILRRERISDPDRGADSWRRVGLAPHYYLELTRETHLDAPDDQCGAATRR